jgi:endonuclease/exonuclease/phosphatase family metal-dependent hydrolase
MHKLLIATAALVSLLTAGAFSSTSDALASTSADGSCPARATRVNDVAVQWFAAPPEDAAEIASWCRAVGEPLISVALEPELRPAPRLEDLVVVTWNAHLADGRLAELIADLRAGKLTGGEPVQHFVLLLQELYRRGSDVPEFAPDARSAYAILPRDPAAPDARKYAEQLGLSITYVPSMRNGAEINEDRGNAIIATEPLQDLFALELPFERQRRVAAGAAIAVKTPAGIERLHLVDTHLEPLAAPSSLWILKNPRRRQVNALLDTVQRARFDDSGVGTIIGGDFNTVQGGDREEAYRKLRAWSQSLGEEDDRSTHLMGRLDYIFARLSPEWQVSTRRIDEKYGSDHHPVLARFHSIASAP